MSVLLWSGDICACVFVFLFKTIVNALAYLDRDKQTDTRVRTRTHESFILKRNQLRGENKPCTTYS